MEQIAHPENPSTGSYPVDLQIAYPDRDLDRLSTAFRFFWIIPIAIVLVALSGDFKSYDGDGGAVIGGGGVLLMATALMIVFREKYPRWWFDWNRELISFSLRVGSYGLLMTDKYPSTDEQQQVRLELPYPDVEHDLNRWLPLVKWFLAIPHYVLLVFLGIGAFFAVIAAWFAILFTGRYPRGLFDYVEGVIRWGTRVEAYAVLLVTDEYPPFQLRP